MSKIIKLEERQPTTMIFDNRRGIEGEPCESQWGESQWKHFVNGDENLIYLPAAAQKKLEASGAQKNDYVTIEKLRRGIFRVTVEEPEAGLDKLPASYTPTQGANALAPRVLQESEERTREYRERDPEPYTQQQRNAQAVRQQIATAAKIMDIEPARPEAKLMLGALFASIDAFHLAQNYASSKGLTITFTSEDVRSFAISAYINASKGARA
jgi:hypothetical protein